MARFRKPIWMSILIVLVVLGVVSVSYNHTIGYVWPGFGSLSIGCGWSSLNFYLENAERANEYTPGLDVDFGKKIHGMSSYDGMITEESGKPPRRWTTFFTQLPDFYISDQDIVFGIPIFWIIGAWIGVGYFFRRQRDDCPHMEQNV